MKISLSDVYEETNVLSELKKAKTPKQVRALCDDLTDKELEEVIRAENLWYHEKSKPRISDMAFDVVKEELAKRKPKSKALKEISAPIPKAEKVDLPFTMSSLDKVKPGEDSLKSFLDRYEGPYVVSDKEDGSALMLDYRRKLTSNPLEIYTRGRNNVGRRVTRIAPYLKIPQKLKDKIAVRGELAMSQSIFNSKFSKDVLGKKDGYENSRALVNSLVNKKDAPAEHLGHSEFIAHELLYPRMKPSKALKYLKKLGFKVAPHVVVPKLSDAVLSKMFEARRKKSKRGVDGLVVEQDKVHNLPAPNNNPSYKVAFKMLEDEAVAQVKVKEVVWEHSKHGLFKPRIEIEPTRLGGVTVTYATGHNAFFIVHGYRKKNEKKGKHKIMPIGPGAVIDIVRSGDVIPHVIRVVKAAKKPALPDSDFVWNKTKVDIKIPKGEKSSVSKIKMITSFFKTLKVENLGEGVVEALYNNGLNSVKKILNASTEDFLKIEGFQIKKAQKLRSSIDDKIKKVPLWVLMSATGIFGAGLGTRKLKPVVEMYPKILDYADLPHKQIAQKLLEVEGFSTTLANQFADNLPRFAKYIKNLNVEWNVPKKKKPTSTKLAGKSFVFTGFRDSEAEAYIVSNGGEVANSVSKNTTALVVKDLIKPSTKKTKAKALGVPLLTGEEFRRKYMK